MMLKPNPQYGYECPISRRGVLDRFEKSWDEVSQIAERHTLAAQSWLPAQAPTVFRFEGQGVRAVSNNMPIHLFNQALGADYDTIDDSAITSDVSALKEFFAQRSTSWIWWLGPGVSPLDMGERLESYGLIKYWDLPTMVAPLPLKSEPILNPRLTVWQARDRTDLEAASLIRHTAFGFPSGVGTSYFEDIPGSWLGNDLAKLYLAREENGPPAAIGAWIVLEGVPGIYVMATLPEWERHGMGRAILTRMMTDAAEAGHELIILTASPKGFGLYQKVGFEYLFDFVLYKLEDGN